MLTMNKMKTTECRYYWGIRKCRWKSVQYTKFKVTTTFLFVKI